MKRRCQNPKDKSFGRYGGKGVSVCDDWQDFKSFYRDMEPTYQEGLMLERLDNNKGYSSENCVWADSFRQAQNRKYCHQLSMGGRTMTIAEWHRELGIKATTIYGRIHRGWSVEKALTA